jgi:hypothetical protein
MKVFLVKMIHETDQGCLDEVVGIFTTKEKVEQVIRVHADCEGITLQPLVWGTANWDGKEQNYLSTFEVEGDIWPEYSYTAQEFELDSSAITKYLAA